MERATMSFEDRRRDFIRAARQEENGLRATKEVDFQNNDAMLFLEELRSFEEESAQTEILVK